MVLSNGVIRQSIRWIITYGKCRRIQSFCRQWYQRGNTFSWKAFERTKLLVIIAYYNNNFYDCIINLFLLNIFYAINVCINSNVVRMADKTELNLTLNFSFGTDSSEEWLAMKTYFSNQIQRSINQNETQLCFSQTTTKKYKRLLTETVKWNECWQEWKGQFNLTTTSYDYNNQWFRFSSQ